MYDELIIGNRGWLLKEQGDRFKLVSTYAPDVWPTGILEADCRCADTYYKYIVPGECMFEGKHSCGLVSLKPQCSLSNGTIFGTIAMFGKVQEFEFGHRAQFAFITALFEDEAICDICWTQEYMDMDHPVNPYLLTMSSDSLATMIGRRLGEWNSLYCDYHAREISDEIFLSYAEVIRSLSLTYDVPLITREKPNEQ